MIRNLVNLLVGLLIIAIPCVVIVYIMIILALTMRWGG